MTAFNNTFIFDAPAIGAPASSWGSNIFVIHNDASTNDTKWNEPHSLVAGYTDGQGVQGTNSQEIIVPSAGLSLELYTASDTAADTTVQMGVFGKVPKKSNITGTDRKWPGDVDSTNYAQPDDMWIPLQNLEAVWVAKNSPTTNAEQATFISVQSDGTISAMKYDDTLGNTDSVWVLSQRTSVYLAGCTSVCVGLKLADGISNGLVLGRFVG